MPKACRNYLETWLQSVDAGRPALTTIARAANHLATCPSCQARLRQLAKALAEPEEDQLSCTAAEEHLLTYIEAQASGQVDGNYQPLQTHLAVCPSCLATYADIVERRMATLADRIPVAATYPTFDLSFLRQGGQQAQKNEQTGASPLLPPISALITGVRIRLGQLLAAQQQLAVIVRSRAPEKPLWTLSYEAEKEGGWEAELTAYAEDETFCRLEVAIYRAGVTDMDLGDLPVTLTYGETELPGKTVTGGKVFFSHIPQAQLPLCELNLPPLSGASAGRQ